MASPLSQENSPCFYPLFPFNAIELLYYIAPWGAPVFCAILLAFADPASFWGLAPGLPIPVAIMPSFIALAIALLCIEMLLLLALEFSYFESLLCLLIFVPDFLYQTLT